MLNKRFILLPEKLPNFLELFSFLNHSSRHFQTFPLIDNSSSTKDATSAMYLCSNPAQVPHTWSMYGLKPVAYRYVPNSSHKEPKADM